MEHKKSIKMNYREREFNSEIIVTNHALSRYYSRYNLGTSVRNDRIITRIKAEVRKGLLIAIKANEEHYIYRDTIYVIKHELSKIIVITLWPSFSASRFLESPVSDYDPQLRTAN